MNHRSESHTDENGRFNSSNEAQNRYIEQSESFSGMVGGNQQAHMVEWLNDILPHLSLPLEASEDELRACLSDGTVLCSILNKLSPGSVETGGSSEPHSVNVDRFLAAVDEMGLPGFDLSDLEQESLVPVLQCLWTLKLHFNFNVEGDNTQNHPRRRWNLSEPEVSNGIPSTVSGEEQQNSYMNSRFQSALRSPVGSGTGIVLVNDGNRIQVMNQKASPKWKA